ncbi:hypothetical protein VI817_000014 [Penicillium citrinum]|nr:hypothetical protein VI817_000014 [Penicillium citrinum]
MCCLSPFLMVVSLAGGSRLVLSAPDGMSSFELVFEVVPEVISIKEDIFVALEQQTRHDCILASNSSSFMSEELLGKVKDETKTRVLNTHFMMPPQICIPETPIFAKLQALIVELMTSGRTAKDIFPFLSQEMIKCGLKPVTAKQESSGFIFNRI